MRSLNKTALNLLLVSCLSLANSPSGFAQLVASPGILEGEQLKKINDIYGEVTSSASGQAGKLIPAFLDSLNGLDQRAISQTYHQFKDLLNDPSVIEALVQALKTNRAEIASNILYNCRNYSGNTLEFTNGQTQELVLGLSSANTIVRKNILQLLSTNVPSNDNSLIQALITVLTSDPSAVVRSTAASSLSHFGREVYFKNAEPIADAFAKALAEDASAQVRSAAANGLSQMGAKAGSASATVCKALTDNSSQVRSNALQAIITIGEPCKAAQAELLDMYNGPTDSNSNYMKDRIIQALMAIGTPPNKTIPLITEMLKKHESIHQASRLLSMMGPKAASAVPELAKALDSPYAYDRQTIAQTLGTIGPAAKGAVEALRKCTKDERDLNGQNAERAKESARDALRNIIGEGNKSPTSISEN